MSFLPFKYFYLSTAEKGLEHECFLILIYLPELKIFWRDKCSSKGSFKPNPGYGLLLYIPQSNNIWIFITVCFQNWTLTSNQVVQEQGIHITMGEHSTSCSSQMRELQRSMIQGLAILAVPRMMTASRCRKLLKSSLLTGPPLNT